MNRTLLTTTYLILVLSLQGQSQRSTYLGINILQLPALTINGNITFEKGPNLSPIIDFGVACNYTKSFDFAGSILTPHNKSANDHYQMDRLTGAYLKLGTFINFRKDFDRRSFPHIGIFLTNSIINQSGYYNPYNIGFIHYPGQNSSLTKYLIGIGTSVGYEFAINKRLSTSIDFQVSFPSANYKDLPGDKEYIPGMGFNDFEGYWFPMLILNLKYKI